jgi:hypothetical protein
VKRWWRYEIRCASSPPLGARPSVLDYAEFTDFPVFQTFLRNRSIRVQPAFAPSVSRAPVVRLHRAGNLRCCRGGNILPETVTPLACDRGGLVARWPTLGRVACDLFETAVVCFCSEVRPLTRRTTRPKKRPHSSASKTLGDIRPGSAQGLAREGTRSTSLDWFPGNSPISLGTINCTVQDCSVQEAVSLPPRPILTTPSRDAAQPDANIPRRSNRERDRHGGVQVLSPRAVDVGTVVLRAVQVGQRLLA